MDSHIVTNIRLEPSKYRYRKIQIYRAKIIGGQLWGFVYGGFVYLCDTLNAVQDSINLLAGFTINQYRLEDLLRTRLPLLGFQKTCDAYAEAKE